MHDSLGLQLDRITTAPGFSEAALAVFRLGALVLPAAAIAVSLSRAGRMALRGLANWSRGSLPRRTVVVTALSILAVALIATWWPNGDYEPIRRDERGTLVEAVRAVPEYRGGRPSFTRGARAPPRARPDRARAGRGREKHALTDADARRRRLRRRPRRAGKSGRRATRRSTPEDTADPSEATPESTSSPTHPTATATPTSTGTEAPSPAATHTPAPTTSADPSATSTPTPAATSTPTPAATCDIDAGRHLDADAGRHLDPDSGGRVVGPDGHGPGRPDDIARDHRGDTDFHLYPNAITQVQRRTHMAATQHRTSQHLDNARRLLDELSTDADRRRPDAGDGGGSALPPRPR